MDITYLFGAGASINAIPIVNGLIKSMRQELDQLQYQSIEFINEIFDTNVNPHVNRNLLEKMKSDFQWVITNSENHQSVDTFAKKLFIKGEFEKLKVVKTVLSLYFIIIQSRSKVDVRYDSFFASILQETHLSFSENLKILSWNYDYQFEKAYSEYSNDERLDACSSQLNVYSKNSRKNAFIKDKFGIIKLNGTAAFMIDINSSKTYNYCQDLKAKYNPVLICTLLENYASLHHIDSSKDKLIPSLSFAWEDYSNGKHIVKEATEFTNKTDVLVVIGYSFPLFNRLVDRDIINAMTSLKKVYFQAPDAEALKERFLAIRDDIEDKNLIVKRDVEQFVFPNEF